MAKVRNDLAHDYDEDIIKACCNKIVHEYIDTFEQMEEIMITRRKSVCA